MNKLVSLTPQNLYFPPTTTFRFYSPSFLFLTSLVPCDLGVIKRYTYRVLQTIQMKLILLWVWAEQAVLGRAKTALKFKY